MPRRWKIFGTAAVVVIAFDQATKFWARSALADGPISVIENFFDWYLSYNTGSAFSMFSGARWALTAVAFVVVGIIAYMVHKERDAPGYQVLAYGAIVGGAIGNLIDRIAFGKVTDFVMWRYHEHVWPVFNVADASLCVGVALLLYGAWRTRGDTSEG